MTAQVLPAGQHDAVAVHVVPFAVDTLPSCLHLAVRIVQMPALLPCVLNHSRIIDKATEAIVPIRSPVPITLVSHRVPKVIRVPSALGCIDLICVSDALYDRNVSGKRSDTFPAHDCAWLRCLSLLQADPVGYCPELLRIAAELFELHALASGFLVVDLIEAGAGISDTIR